MNKCKVVVKEQGAKEPKPKASTRQKLLDLKGQKVVKTTGESKCDRYTNHEDDFSL